MLIIYLVMVKDIMINCASHCRCFPKVVIMFVSYNITVMLFPKVVIMFVS